MALIVLLTTDITSFKQVGILPAFNDEQIHAAFMIYKQSVKCKRARFSLTHA